MVRAPTELLRDCPHARSDNGAQREKSTGFAAARISPCQDLTQLAIFLARTRSTVFSMPGRNESTAASAGFFS